MPGKTQWLGWKRRITLPFQDHALQIVVVMCPTPLCGRERRLDGFRGRTADVGPHNVLQGVDPIEHGLVVLPYGAIAGCR
jgi:hypothetical protein